MFLSDRSIERPVLTTVVTAAILLVGWLGYRGLPVRELPKIDFPIVSVTTVLPGASPEVVETEVTEVLESDINTIEGIRKLSSVSGEGASLVTVEFELSRDIDLALQDVRDKVSRVRGQLPDDVEEPVIAKLDPDAQPIIWLTLQNPSVDMTEVNDYAENVIKDRLQTLPGVGSVIFGGAQRFAVRVRLDAQKLAAYDLTVPDIRRALQEGNVEIPSGRIESDSREFSVRTEGQFTTPEQFNDLIVAWRDGVPVRLGAVGRAVAGVENERTIARFNGEPTIGLGVVRQPEANTVDVARLVHAEVDRIRANLPPGYILSFAVDNSEHIQDSLHEVQQTLVVAFLLVVALIYLFLHSGWATLIPTLAIPVSLIGSFAALSLLGFSINTLTLLALVLVIGIVIDDAIVVLENTYRHMEEGKSARDAARDGTGEIAFAVIAISLTLIIVFLPLGFISGVIGRLFREFALTVAVAVAISAFVSLTLTPMVSSRYLKLGSPRGLLLKIERGLAWLTDRYGTALGWALGHRVLVLGLAVASLVASGVLMAVMGKEFAPPEDRGGFMASVKAPEGATLAYTDSYLRQIEEMARETEGIDRYFSAIGLGFGGPASVNSGFVYIRLKDDRKLDQFEIMDRLRAKVRKLAGVNVYLISFSAFQTGRGKPLQYVIQNPDLDQLSRASEAMVARMRRTPGLQAVDTDLKLDKPKLSVTVNRAKAAAVGVRVADVATTLQVLLGGQDLSKFRRGNERFDVIAQLRKSDRSSPDDLRSIFLRGAGGQLVQLANVVDVREGVGPSQINHVDRIRAATLDANLDGIPLGEGLKRVDAIAAETLTPKFRTEVTGEAQLFRDSISSLLFALFLAVVAVYLVLAGQFESFVHPLTIMLALPFAFFGAVVSLAALGMTLNIYSMIGVIMLVGLVTKNSILLVDYTNTLRRRGMARREAVIRAGLVRLRPILMTSTTVILGVAPIALALGAGAESRRPLGVAVMGGMTVSTVLTLFVVPTFYLALDDALAWVRRHARLRAGRRELAGQRRLEI
ncbi:MAG: efflux RND transporter permease subunit [Gemmatimonadota bacterium]